MTPIESPYDTRFVILIGLAMCALEDMALNVDADPQLLLAEYLFVCNKQIAEKGTEGIANRLLQNYPILNEAIT